MGLLSSILGVFTGGPQAKAIKKASDVQAKAAEQVQKTAEQTQTSSIADLEAALQAAQGQFGAAGAKLDPYASAGTTALSAIQSVLGLGPPEQGNSVISALQSAPGYQFGLNQGVSALDRSANAGSGIYSGAQGKALTQYGQDYAGTKLGGVLDRIQSLVSGGQNAATDQANIGTQGANAVLNTGQNKANVRLGVLDDISNAISGAAAARAGGITGAANARSAGAGNVLSLLGNVGKFFLGGGTNALTGLFGGGGAGSALNAVGYSGLV